MKPAKFEYFSPVSVDDAVAMRTAHPGAAILAGGQSLLPIMNFRLGHPEHVIDIGKVGELAYVRSSPEEVVVGSMTRQRDLERDASALRANPLIRETLLLVAHPVVRNRGTVGGSIAHADPAAELPTLLACLGGTVEVAGPRGRRTISAADLFMFHLTTSIEPEEVLVSVSFPVLGSSWGWSFVEVSRRHGDFAVAGVCCALQFDEARHVQAVQMSACGISSTPLRLTAAEEALVSRDLSEGVIREAGRAAATYVTVRDETQASTAYRKQLTGELVGRAVRSASNRAAKGGEYR